MGTLEPKLEREYAEAECAELAVVTAELIVRPLDLPTVSAAFPKRPG